MLHPAIEVRSKGAIEGNGLFATRSIREGELVWQLDEPTLTWVEVEQLSDDDRAAFDHYGFQCGVDRFSLPTDASREGNHSCDPNTWWVSDDSLVACRDIAADEEVTYDYSSADVVIDFSMLCNCGAARCRGRVSNKDYMLPSFQKQYAGHLPSHVNAAIAALSEE